MGEKKKCLKTSEIDEPNKYNVFIGFTTLEENYALPTMFQAGHLGVSMYLCLCYSTHVCYIISTQ